MIGLNSVITHAPSIVTRKTGNEYVLVPVTDNIASMDSVFTLNETGAFIWEHLDGRQNIGEIISALTEEYDVGSEQAAEDLFSFVRDLEKYLIVK